jgi:hypothetical protein
MKDFLIKNKIWILVIAYIAGSFYLIQYLFLPKFEKIKQQANEIQEKGLDKKILEQRLSELNKMEGEFNFFQENKDRLGKIISESEEVVFIQFLENLAQESGNEIIIQVPEEQYANEKSKNSAKSKLKKKGNILSSIKYKNFLVLDVALAGDFQQAFEFIKRLENSEYFSNIISLDMEKVEKKENSYSGSIFSSSEKNISSKEEYLKTLITLIVYKK